VTLTLADEIDISRGDMIASGPDPMAARSLEATIVWFDSKPLDLAGDYLVKHTSQIVPVRLDAVEYRVNINSMHAEQVTSLAMNEVGVVRMTAARPLFFDPYRENRGTGAFILIDRKTDATAAAGMIVTAAAGGVESSTDRVVRLVRAAIPTGARLNLPEEDDAAVKQLRELFKGLMRHE
jgi:sulfate adenylyltransferase subunit 1 (EFTu-like GTPase family)